ncbi:MAG TPA: 2-oxo acid dehydrogenase subunit E2 [Vicinamibacterales bacterium]
MPIEFKIPELGENVKGGDVLRVLVNPGDTIAKDQPVIELETDKATIEVPSSVEGRVASVQVKAGEKVTVGQTILTVEEGAAASAAAPPPAEAPAPAAEAPAQPAAPEQAGPASEGPRSVTPAEQPQASGGLQTFTVPELGENVKGGDVLRVLVKPGDTITKDQPVLELETDKATIEVPSSVAGVVREVTVKAGDKVTVGQTILTVEGGAGAPAAAPKAEAAPTAAGPGPGAIVQGFASPRAAEPARARSGPAEVVDISRGARPAAAAAAAEVPRDTRPPAPAAPSVRRLARELGLDIHDVPGSGPGGRISADDVMAYAKRVITGKATGAAAAGAPAAVRAVELPDFSKWGPIDTQPMRAIRRKTAEQMALSWSTVPHVTQGEKADITELEALRVRYAKQAEQAGGKLTVTAVVLKVVAAALKAFPQVNASIDVANETIIYKQYVHIGVAVDTERGLLVPVIRDVDRKSIFTLAAELQQTAEKARAGKLSLDEMQGGCFTITNLGGIGGTYFTPIVNHPEVAILGMSRSRTEPVWQDGQFVPRLMLPLSLSYDHRLVDGADAIRFLRFIVERLEQPFLLALQ